MTPTRASVTFFEKGRQIAHRTLSRIPLRNERVTLFGLPYLVDSLEFDGNTKPNWQAVRVHVRECQ